MSGGDLIALAERVEAATGADRRLDAEIAHTLCWRWDGWEEGDLKVEDRPLEVFVDRVLDSYNSIFRHIPAYTASLDAAMTLVPEGWTFATLSQSDRKGWWCELRRGHLTSYDATAFGAQLENSSPALALCAAALRARATFPAASTRPHADGTNNASIEAAGGKGSL